MNAREKKLALLSELNQQRRPICGWHLSMATGIGRRVFSIPVYVYLSDLVDCGLVSVSKRDSQIKGAAPITEWEITPRGIKMLPVLSGKGNAALA